MSTGIGIGSGGSNGSAADAVKYTAQALTEQQKAQARTNIDAAKDIPVVSPASAASYEIEPDTLTKLGTLTGAKTLTLAAAPSDGKAHLYHFIFTADSTTIPTFGWPQGIEWSDSNEPTITAGKTYEISIMDGLALYKEY